jgi:hypothetical protein
MNRNEESKALRKIGKAPIREGTQKDLIHCIKELYVKFEWLNRQVDVWNSIHEEALAANKGVVTSLQDELSELKSGDIAALRSKVENFTLAKQD